jgi:preprotein translocase subunit SecD
MLPTAHRIVLAGHARLPWRLFASLTSVPAVLGACAVSLMVVSAAAEPLTIELVDAQVGYARGRNEPIISFRMSPASQKAFAQLTAANVDRQMAMRVDGATLSAPVIREPILGGSGQISGRFTAQQAEDIAARLRSGKSKLEMEILN